MWLSLSPSVFVTLNRNLGGLASFLKIYAVDWLGTGLSGRPPFTATGQKDTEAFFLDSMVRWRHQVNGAMPFL